MLYLSPLDRRLPTQFVIDHKATLPSDIKDGLQTVIGIAALSRVRRSRVFSSPYILAQGWCGLGYCAKAC
jgi:hypothetical protein